MAYLKDYNERDELPNDQVYALVIRKSLLTPTHEKQEDWLKTNIFHLPCAMNSKVYNLLINGESCENLAFHEAMTKLMLSTERHLCCYKLSWLIT